MEKRLNSIGSIVHHYVS